MEQGPGQRRPHRVEVDVTGAEWEQLQELAHLQHRSPGEIVYAILGLKLPLVYATWQAYQKSVAEKRPPPHTDEASAGS